MRRALAYAPLVALAAFGCGPSPSDTGSEADSGADTDAPAAPATFTEIHTALFPQATPAKCDFCHAQPPSQVSNGLLNMGTDDRDAAYAAIIDHSSVSRDCLGMPFVVPGDPESSLFYLKLLDVQACGERMPLGGGALPAAQIEMVRSWIADGARDN